MLIFAFFFIYLSLEVVVVCEITVRFQRENAILELI
jgi:hypothetical protein